MEVNRAPPLLQKPLFIEGILDVQEFGGEHGGARWICVCPPLLRRWDGIPGMVGCECLAQPGGVLPELGTVGFLRQRAAEALQKHCSLDQDLQRSQITVRLCNTQA